jgi:hypothetical protein
MDKNWAVYHINMLPRLMDGGRREGLLRHGRQQKHLVYPLASVGL